MAHDSLVDFVTVLQDAGDVVRISAPVDPHVELAAITDEVVRRSRDGGPVLWFSNAGRSGWPVLTNLLGHSRRICRALNIETPEAASRLLLEDQAHTSSGILQELWGTKFLPKTVRQAPCQQVIKLGKDVNLWDLPQVRNGTREPFPVVSAGLTLTPHPKTSVTTVGGGVLQIIDRLRLLPHWHSNDPRLDLVRRSHEQRRQLPVAVVVGSAPILGIGVASADWLAHPVDYAWVGGLGRKSLNVVKCRSHDLEVPADAELVIEGFIDVETEWESSHAVALPNGRYSGSTSVPPIQVTAITHRANPLYPLTVAGRSAGEVARLRDVVDRMFLPEVQSRSAAIRDCFRPSWGEGNVAFVRIEKRQALAARTVAHAIWSVPGLKNVNLLVIVDDDVCLRAESDVWNRVSRNVDPQRDVFSTLGPCHPDHYASAIPGVGGKLAIDATRKFSDEGGPTHWPETIEYPAELVQSLKQRWDELGLGMIAGDRA